MRSGDKAGAQHIEMVLASVIFISFVFFVLVFLKPYDSNVLTASLVDDVYNVLKNNVSVSLSEIFIRADSNSVNNENCFSIDVSDLELKYPLTNASVFKAKENTKVDAELSSDLLEIKEKDKDESYRILVSSALEQDSLSDCKELNGNGLFEIGGIIEYKIFSYKELQTLESIYESNYEDLKKAFGVPSVYDFSITSSIVSMEKESIDNSDVIAKTFVEKVLLKNGTILNEQIIIKTW